MMVRQRNNIRVLGDGPITLLFAHGFGCDQNMWLLTEFVLSLPQAEFGREQ